MKLSAPTQIVWIIAVILGVLGLLGHFAGVPVGGYSFELLAVGFILLTLGTMLKGM